MVGRVLRQFLGTLLIGIVAACLIVSDLSFTSQAVRGTATIFGSTNGAVVATPGRSGRTFADATVIVDGRLIIATVRAWYRWFEVGERVPVLYLPSDPKALIPDGFWQSHFASVVGTTLFAVVAVGEGLRFWTKRRRSPASLLRGD